MKKNSLAQAFNIKTKPIESRIITDYDIFPDKKLLDTLRTKIIQNLIDMSIPTDTPLTDFINEEVNKVIEGYDLSNLERSHIFNLIDDEINGFGPLTNLLKDENITEIMVNSPHEIYIESEGKIIKDESVSFIDDEHIKRTIARIIQPLGRKIDTKNPMVDSRLPDGSRINTIIPPLSPKGPVITIRKFKTTMVSIDELLRIGTLTPYMARFLEASVQSKLNIIICGGSGSGKTTLLNILSSFIENNERIITVEDTTELKLNQNHVITLETRNKNYEDEGEVSIRDLIINSLRMRPDRIIVGEVRGKEAFDMLQAMNTGHEGSMTSLHANGPIDALNRLESMVLMAGMDLPSKAIREYITNAIDLVVNMERMSDGKRKVTSICEIDAMNGDIIELKEIFSFTQTGLTDTEEVDGEFKLHSEIPAVYNKIKAKGITTLEDIFESNKEGKTKKNKKQS